MFELRDQEDERTPPAEPALKPRVTSEMLTLFCKSYLNLAGEMPDPSAVRASLELVLRLDADNGLKLHRAAESTAGAFTVYGQAFTGKVNLGAYGTLEGAVKAAQNMGLFGEPGEVTGRKRVVDPATGVAHLRERTIYGNRWTPLGIEEFGFMDLREFEYCTRLVGMGPVMVYSHDAPAYRDGVLQPRGAGVVKKTPQDVRALLLQSSQFVGVWRRVGSTYWQGEFTGRTDEALDQWLPKRRYTE